jgi:hypothetical protein
MADSIENEYRAGRSGEIATPETSQRVEDHHPSREEGHRLVERWDKCLNLYGDYVEK